MDKKTCNIDSFNFVTKNAENKTLGICIKMKKHNRAKLRYINQYLLFFIARTPSEETSVWGILVTYGLHRTGTPELAENLLGHQIWCQSGHTYTYTQELQAPLPSGSGARGESAGSSDLASI